MAEEVLKDIIAPNAKKEVTPQVILDVVAEHYGISPSDIIGGKRNAEIVVPRQIVMYLCREYTDISLQNIGKILNKKDHTTIMHGINKIEERIATDEELRNKIDIIKKKISPS